MEPSPRLLAPADAPPLILLPGLGVGPALYAAQAARFANLRVPSWIAPELDEPLADYAARLAATVDPGRPCVVGGHSFGGVVAAELARHLDARALVIISSVLHPEELPRGMRHLLPFSSMLTPSLAARGQAVAKRVLPLVGRVLTEPHAAMLAEAPEVVTPEMIAWPVRALARWRESKPSPPAVPTHRLHGTWDLVFPLGLLRRDDAVALTLVPRGDHVLPVTSPTETKSFLHGVLASLDE